MESAAKEGEGRAEKKRKKKFDDEVKSQTRVET